MSGPELTHLNRRGEARMVDVGDKEVTDRVAVAEGLVRMSAELVNRLFEDDLPKGDAIGVARVAGIMAAKRTPELIPLCHPLPLSSVEVTLEPQGDSVRIVATVSTTGRTGVEMEAMTAVSVAALTIYDMVKGLERGASIETVRLLHKGGGKSGRWKRDDNR
jgi:cyclic pyranopterin phosphate synthase